MSHVDDGELTAYADGAYRVDDPVALRIGAHLSTCDNCRTRLEQSHELRDRAAVILGYAIPAPSQTPSFESLQAQLATPTPKPRRSIPLAWAASIIMAVGLGWFGRSAWENPPVASQTAMETRGDAQLDVSAPVEEEAQQSISDRAPPRTPTPAPSAAPAAETRVAKAEETDAGQREVAADVARRSRDEVVGMAAAGAAAGRAVAAPPPPALARAQSDRAANFAADAQYISAAEAERRGIVVPRIPELPIARIGLNADATVVEQTLPDGKLIRLTVRPDVVEAKQRAAAAQEAAAPAPTAAQKTVAPNVVIRQGGKLITVTGELAPDSLRALGQKIR
jgi:hypothetical protein